MISVVIPTLNAEAGLPACLSALVPAMVEGLVREVVVVDGGSTDQTLRIADQAGVEVLAATEANRGAQLALGAAKSRHPWLLFLHADTALGEGWVREVRTFIDRIETGERRDTIAAFRFALDDEGLKPRLLEAGVALRCALLKLPYGDQGLLISRRRYTEIGGYRPLRLMEDVAIVQSVPRRDRIILRTPAVTSAKRYRRDGYLLRPLRNWLCIALYSLRAPQAWIERIYGIDAPLPVLHRERVKAIERSDKGRG